MYLSQLTIRNFRQFGEGATELSIDLRPGMTALVGRNDSGKSAIIDAIRYALLTRDQEYIRVCPEDFNIAADGKQANEIHVRCRLTGLSDSEKGAFIEYLSYESNDVSLYVHWSARKLGDFLARRRWVDVSVRSGVNGAGPVFEMSVRELLSAAYLRPLRDAEREMSPGRGSRLSQILSNAPGIKDGTEFDELKIPQDAAAVKKLGLVGLANHMRYHVSRHSGISKAESAINTQYLTSLSLRGDDLRGKIEVSESGTENARLRQILERLELGLLDAATGKSRGRYGLGSNNLLFMACELLLLGKEPDGLPLLLIEEPEAHLHPQRQLRLMEFLGKATESEIEDANRSVQVILSTHSPNLASKIPLGNLVLLQGQQAHSLAEGQTKLKTGDYRFLERFLDVTKANLFFAHGVLVVEGAAESILLPVLAKLIGRDLTEHGVTIINVGGKGLRRFSRIFQRKNEHAPKIDVPVACLADMDVMPDCAPKILGMVTDDNDPIWQSNKRRWKAKGDFGNDTKIREAALEDYRHKLKTDDGQLVRTFVADHWTLEYDLARCGLAEEILTAAILAMKDDALNSGGKDFQDVIEKAKKEYLNLSADANNDPEVLCSKIYEFFHSRAASKAVAAQHLAELLRLKFEGEENGADKFRSLLPRYLVHAIEYVTPQQTTNTSADGDSNA